VATALEGPVVPEVKNSAPMSSDSAGAAGGVVVTASHNPPEFNGLKYKPDYGGSAPPEVVGELERLTARAQQDDDAVRALGVQHCIAQCVELLEAGVPGLHFYTFNRARGPIEILAALRGQQLLAS